MKLENEITVLVKTDYKSLLYELEQNGFIQKEEYIVDDIYMIDNKMDIFNMETLNILKKCVLVRNVEGIEKELLYKYKEIC